jgi:hypothetical protein
VPRLRGALLLVIIFNLMCHMFSFLRPALLGLASSVISLRQPTEKVKGFSEKESGFISALSGRLAWTMLCLGREQAGPA